MGGCSTPSRPTDAMRAYTGISPLQSGLTDCLPKHQESERHPLANIRIVAAGGFAPAHNSLCLCFIPGWVGVTGSWPPLSASPLSPP
eukprot:1743429-Amphidinium_carterae.1